MAKRKKKGIIPLCPGNTEEYLLVNTREGYYWRKKRGTIKPAKLNAAFKNNAKLTGILSPVTSAIREKLSPFLEYMDTGRFLANVSGRLKKAYNQTGKLSFLGLTDYDLQPYYPFEKLFRGSYKVHVNKSELSIEILLRENIVKALTKMVTGYYFEAILLYGDPAKQNSLRIDSEVSPVYNIHSTTDTVCRLSLLLPAKKTSYMVLLKLSCMNGKTPAYHASQYGMKVVWTGQV